MEKPVAVFDPAPRTKEMMFTEETWQELNALVELRNVSAPGALSEAVYVIGQTDMDSRRLAEAENLKAIINVEGNFLPNVDYAAAATRCIHVLNISPVFAQAVAEMSLALSWIWPGT